MFSYKSNKLFCESVSIEKIVKKTGTPVYIYSKKQLSGNYNSYDAAFKGYPHIICFAVKSNSNYHLCKTLFDSGAGADVTSGGELYRSLNAGASPSKIVYAGVGKSRQEIEYAVKSNILMFNVESVEELKLINDVAGKSNKKVDIAFRVNPGIDPHTHKHISTGLSETKFGIPIKNIVETYVFAGQYKNIRLTGIHCHIGSQITEISPFNTMAKTLEKIYLELGKNNIHLTHINLGGGLGITYNNEIPPEIPRLVNLYLTVFKKYNIKIILEPGRSIVGNAGIIAAKVLFNKPGENKKFIIVDAGMNDLIRPSFYDAYHKIIPVKKSGSKKSLYDIVGPICETGDFLGKSRELPVLKQNDLLGILCAGAYGFSMSSQYNSRCRAAEILVDKSDFKIIRRKETYRDLISHENI